MKTAMRWRSAAARCAHSSSFSSFARPSVSQIRRFNTLDSSVSSWVAGGECHHARPRLASPRVFTDWMGTLGDVGFTSRLDIVADENDDSWHLVAKTAAEEGDCLAAIPRTWMYCAESLYEAGVNFHYGLTVADALKGYRGLLESGDEATARWFRLVELGLLTLGELEGFDSPNGNDPSLWSQWLRALPASSNLRNALYTDEYPDTSRVFDVLAKGLYSDLAPHFASYCPSLADEETFVETMRWICGALLDRAWDLSKVEAEMWKTCYVSVPIGIDFAMHSGHPNTSIVAPQPGMHSRDILALQAVCVQAGVRDIPVTHVPYILLCANERMAPGDAVTIDYGLRTVEEAKRSHGFELPPRDVSAVPEGQSTILTPPWDELVERNQLELE